MAWQKRWERRPLISGCYDAADAVARDCLQVGVSALPRARGRPVRTPAPMELGEHHVLVVEDEALVAMDLTDVLQQQGFKVIGPAPSVARALALLDETRIDAALLDLNLNGEPGLPVAL